MPESALGVWLKGLRERSELSLRDLAQRSGVDHAYIHRLETGAKEAPSMEVINKLISALSMVKRDQEILIFLAKNQNTDIKIVEFAQRDKSMNFTEFKMLTSVVNRGSKPDFSTSLARIRRILEEEDE